MVVRVIVASALDAGATSMPRCRPSGHARLSPPVTAVRHAFAKGRELGRGTFGFNRQDAKSAKLCSAAYSHIGTTLVSGISRHPTLVASIRRATDGFVFDAAPSGDVDHIRFEATLPITTARRYSSSVASDRHISP